MIAGDEAKPITGMTDAKVYRLGGV